MVDRRQPAGRAHRLDEKMICGPVATARHLLRAERHPQPTDGEAVEAAEGTEEHRRHRVDVELRSPAPGGHDIEQCTGRRVVAKGYRR